MKNLHKYGLFPEKISAPGEPLRIGLLEGEGIGPAVTQAAMDVLSIVASSHGFKFEVRKGGSIGQEAERSEGAALPESVVRFCAEIFQANGVVLAGAGGGRFVYDIRRRLSLFCKLTPIRPFDSLRLAGPLAAEYLDDVDILLVRENLGGVYQGTWTERRDAGGRVACEHKFNYHEDDVMNVLRVAARAAAQCDGELTVVVKENGVPTISSLWKRCSEIVANEFRLSYSLLDVDYAGYKIVSEARRLRVVVAPNLIGDILGDLAAAFLSSRGNSFSASYSAEGHAIYQTNHGAAHDLAGADKANPVGQILALAMMLSESHGRQSAADHIVRAIGEVWRQGWRTFDVAEPGCRIIGTREITERICRMIELTPPPL